MSGLILSVLFGWGLAKGLAGNAGEVVHESPARTAAVPESGDRNGAGQATENRRDLIVLLGDSLARGDGDEMGEGIGGRLSEILDDLDREYEIANLGVSGAKTGDLLEQIERASVTRLLSESSMVLVSIGGNDFFGERDFLGISESVPENPAAVIDSIQTRIEEVVKKIRDANGEANIFILGLYNPFSSVPDGQRLTPLVAQWNSGLLERFSSDPRVVIVQTSDLFLVQDRLSADRFHPNGEAYGLIARRIADAL